MNNKNQQLILPAIRGVMGNWVYYSCLMALDEISNRVNYAEEIHKNALLSDMIQRRLQKGRSSQIAEYLKTQKERFFNSLVIAIYGGEPNWYGMSKIHSKTEIVDLKNLDEELIESIGFLTLRGDERLFAIDGQHRLAGIKKAIKDGIKQEPYDEISVIVVSHTDSTKGIERTRRLFTTLNKTAKPVSKGDIIVLDEDDVMAISVRWLIEETAMFADERIAFVASNNMPVRNQKSLTTIGNLYDVLTIVFTSIQSDIKKPKYELRKKRPDEKVLKQYFQLAEKYFVNLRKNFIELDEFFSAKNTEQVILKYRGSHGGDALFRPIGLELFAQIIARLSKDMPLAKAVRLAAKLPRNLEKAPFVGLMWDPSNKTILNTHKVTLRETLLFMLGKQKFSEKTLVERYRKEVGDNTISLPDKLV